jgi:hypothetical protein
VKNSTASAGFEPANSGTMLTTRPPKPSKEQRNILREISEQQSNWIGHILRRNCLLQQVIEGKIKGGIEVTGRRGRRRRKLLDDLKERKGYSHRKENPLGRTMWRDSSFIGI